MTPLDDLFERHPVLKPVRSATMGAFALLADCAASGGTLYVCGNGGSAADAEHIVGELMKGMTRRRPLPAADRTALLGAAAHGLEADASYLADHLDGAVRAVCLSSQSSLLTAVANDLGADLGFAQQVFSYGGPSDVLWAISTSGRSRNVVLAALAARARGMSVLALTGPDGSVLGGLAAVCIEVPGTGVSVVQELHRPVYHALCQALEDACFPLGPPGAS